MTKMMESVAMHAQTPFKNAPFTDFSKMENRQAQLDALAQVKSELGQTHPLIIGGKKIASEATFASINPSNPEQVVGYFASATIEQANEAVQAAEEAFKSWKRVPVPLRAWMSFARSPP